MSSAKIGERGQPNPKGGTTLKVEKPVPKKEGGVDQKHPLP